MSVPIPPLRQDRVNRLVDALLARGEDPGSVRITKILEKLGPPIRFTPEMFDHYIKHYRLACVAKQMLPSGFPAVMWVHPRVFEAMGLGMWGWGKNPLQWIIGTQTRRIEDWRGQWDRAANSPVTDGFWSPVVRCHDHGKRVVILDWPMSVFSRASGGVGFGPSLDPTYNTPTEKHISYIIGSDVPEVDMSKLPDYMQASLQGGY